MYWGARLVELALGGVALSLGTDVGHVRRTAQARLAEINPLRAISANHDLLRALRIAWVRAALDVLDAALARCRTPEGRAISDEVERFDDLARPLLRALRSAAFNRSAHAGDSVVDASLDLVLAGVSTAVAGDGPAVPDPLTERFGATLAALVDWPEAELPPVVLAIAAGGVPLAGHRGAEGVMRPFGELVFAEFADLIKDPKKYPQAGAAFQVALAQGTRELARQTLATVQGQDARLDAALAGLDALQALRDGLARETEGLDALREQVAAVSETTVERLMQRLQDEGALSGVDRRTLIALAQRLTGEEVRDVDRAVKELQHAVEVASRVVAPGAATGDRFVASLLERAAERTRAGELDAASELLDDGLADLQRQEAEFAAALKRSRSSLIEAAVQQELLKRDAYAAARRLETLAALDDPERAASSSGYRERMTAFYREGADRGLGLSLQVSCEMARRSIERSAGDPERSAAEDQLAAALMALGNLDADDACLAEAVAVCRRQCERLRAAGEAAPLLDAERGLARALQMLGTRRGDVAIELESVALMHSVIERLPRTAGRNDRADVEHDLGRVLYNLGARLSDAERLREGITAFTSALEGRTRAERPLEWASTQANLGIALAMLARIDGQPVTRRRAVSAFREVLKVRTREAAPLDWSRAQNNLGIELMMLGRQTEDAAMLEQAIAALRAALTVFEPDNRPVLWAMTQHNLGGALQSLGTLRGDAASFEASVAALRIAASQFDREHSPVFWTAAHCDLGVSLALLAKARRDPAPLDEAERMVRAAIEERHRSGAPLELALAELNLATVQLARAEFSRVRADAEVAAASYRRALETLTAERMPVEHGEAHAGLARALALL